MAIFQSRGNKLKIFLITMFIYKKNDLHLFMESGLIGHSNYINAGSQNYFRPMQSGCDVNM